MGWMGKARLEEYTSTLFFTADGEAVQFGDGAMTYGNAPLAREIDPAGRAFQLAETNPDDKRLREGALITLSRAHAALQEPEMALDLLSLNARLHPQSLTALRYLAKAYFDLGDMVHAEQVCRRILELDPQNESALKMLEQI